MDYHRDTGTNLWSLPRGIERNDGVGGLLAWTAKYGSLVAGAFDMMTVDGMNEAGLAGHILWLAESDYRLPEPKSKVEAVAGMFSVIRNVAQPFRIPDPDKPYASQTIWQTVADLTNKRYVFDSTTRPNIVWVDLDKLDFSEDAPAGKLDLMSDTALEGGLAGNVTGRFEATDPMQFLTLPS